jgi:ABC-type uncharacterized transport system permease subunit
MAQKPVIQDQGEFPLPLAAMMVMGILGAIVVGASFEVIKVWPLPASVAPYFGWKWGAVWGLVVGCIHGFVLGYLTDDRHFSKPQ